MNKVVGIIPARFHSSRFPGKPLASLLGKPMIVHVAENTAEALGAANTFVATDNADIARVVEEAGFQVLMTSSGATTGTDRLWEAAQQVTADYFINIQGDEPLLDPADIIKIVNEKCSRGHGIVNGMTWLAREEDPWDRNIPKVVVTEDNRLVYMSRLPIPGFKDHRHCSDRYLKQVCIYAFTYSELRAFGEYGRKSRLEEKEDIEILRFLDLSIPVYMVHTNHLSLSVDVPEDLFPVEAAMRLSADLEEPTPIAH